MFYVSCVTHAFVSVQCCLVVTCWERADLLAVVGDVYCIFVTFSCGILGQVWYLISLSDLCRLFLLFKIAIYVVCMCLLISKIFLLIFTQILWIMYSAYISNCIAYLEGCVTFDFEIVDFVISSPKII